MAIKKIKKPTKLIHQNLIPEARKLKRDILFSFDEDGVQKAKLKAESLFDWYFNKGHIDAEQHDISQDYFFAWYHGVFASHPKMTASYEMITSGGGSYDGLNYSDFQVMCRQKYDKLCSVLEKESRLLLDNVCMGIKASEVVPNPKYYANERLRKSLDTLVDFKGCR